MSSIVSLQSAADQTAMLAARLAAIVESSDDAIIGKDLNGVVTSWNGGAQRIFGYTAEEMIGQPFARLIAAERMDEEADVLARIGRGERIGNLETVRVAKDGRRIDVSVTVSPIRDASGRVVGASKVARDITERKNAEQQKAWLASFPERNPNPIVEVNAEDGAVHYMNPFAGSLFPELPAARFGHPLLAGIPEAVKNLRSGEAELIRREIAVGQCWFAQTITHIPEADRIRIYCNDVTARRAAETKLRLSEYSVENASIPIFLVAPDSRILNVNRAACETLGYAAEELCSMTVPDLAPEFSPEAWHPHWEELRRKKQMRFETTNRRKDGTVFPVEVEVNLFEFEGHEYNFVCVHEITERRRVAGLLEGQLKLLQKIASGRPLAKTLTDIVSFAEAQVEGMRCSFLFYDEMAEVLRHGSAPSLPEAYNRIVDGLRVGPAAGSCGTAAYRREMVIVRDIAADPLWAKYRDVAAKFGLAACWSAPVFGADRTLLGTFGIYFGEPSEPGPEHLKLIDIITQTAAVAIDHSRTEERIRKVNASLEHRVAQRTKELEDANHELESFSYSVSHDLRAPLRHVLGYVEMLQRATEGLLPEKAGRYLKTITAAAGEMGDLIDDLLAFSRTGRAEMKADSVSLDELVQNVIRGLEMTTKDRRIEWKIDPLPVVNGDVAMLKLVLMNLIGNAVKYSRTRDQARIEIGCASVQDGRATIFVRDNGVGFDMKYSGKLFGVFQRLHLREEFEGTGIGLATVRRIITRHGGTVRAEGALNEGATFPFTIGTASTKSSHN